MVCNPVYESLLRDCELDSFEKVMAAHAGEGVKQGRWGEVRRLPLCKETVYLKRRFCSGRWPSDLVRLRGRRKALGEWDNLRLCRRLGIPAPEPVAAGARGALWKQQSFVMSRAIDGVPLPSWWSGETSERPLRWRLLRQVGEVTRRLHDCNLCHNDLYLEHFMVTGNERGDPQVVLLDLNRMEHHRKPCGNRAAKDLGKLLLSARVDVQLSRSDSLRLLLACLGKPRLDADGRRTLAQAAKKARWVHTHAPRYSGSREKRNDAKSSQG
jgi:tRNA A-37 threonylcarbamoyl transferase component Bud32